MSFEHAINETINNVAKNITVEPEDYIGDDGLLYCGKCKTRKQGEYTMPWGVIRPYHLCECAERKRDEEEARHKKEQLMFKERERLSFLRSTGRLETSIKEICKMSCPEAFKEIERICFPEKSMRQWSFENDDMQNARITNAMKSYVENFEEMHSTGQGLLLYGKVGTGKTYAAAEVANALLDLGFSALVTNFARIANTVHGLYDSKQAYYDSLKRFDLLVIDDLAAERKTEYMQEIVFNVIDSRYRAGLPMIITTNLTAEELKNPQDIGNKRIFDRIMERCLPIEVEFSNRRHQKTAAKFAELNGLLGL